MCIDTKQKEQNAIEMVLRSLYGKGTTSKEYHIDMMCVSLLNTMMEHLLQASEIIFENLTKYRFNEYKAYIFHLKIVSVLEGIKTIKINVLENGMATDVTPTLVKLFGHTTGDNNSGVKWIGVVKEVEKRQTNVDNNSF